MTKGGRPGGERGALGMTDAAGCTPPPGQVGGAGNRNLAVSIPLDTTEHRLNLYLP